jgi:hypothetical protein
MKLGRRARAIRGATAAATGQRGNNAGGRDLADALLCAPKTVAPLSTATAKGSLNLAAVPVPFVLPLLPAVPASVVTTPPAVILRMVLLVLSAT